MSASLCIGPIFVRLKFMSKFIDGVRVSGRGGWRGSPNSLAALVPTYFPNQHIPRCARCGRPALKGRRFCQWHGKHGLCRPSPGRAESAILSAMGRLGLLPLELIALPAWRALTTVPVAARAPVRLRLVLLWHKRFTEPMFWAQAWRQALALPSKAPTVPERWFARDA
jgi:hypothetical protein